MISIDNKYICGSKCKFSFKPQGNVHQNWVYYPNFTTSPVSMAYGHGEATRKKSVESMKKSVESMIKSVETYNHQPAML